MTISSRPRNSHNACLSTMEFLIPFVSAFGSRLANTFFVGGLVCVLSSSRSSETIHSRAPLPSIAFALRVRSNVSATRLEQAFDSAD